MIPAIPVAFPAPRAVRFEALPPLSLYVHVPWCVRKCPYCDFNSHEPRAQTGAGANGEIPADAFVDAALRDLELALPMVWGRPVHTVFFGGGTPSLLPASAVERLISGIRARVRLIPDAEITLEANPGTFEAARFEGFLEAGVNRLSLGVQSFDAGALQRIGRIHDDQAARAAAAHAIQTFGRVNLDLMYALPGQTIEAALRDVDQALAFGPRHLSLYHLTLEPNTLFAARPPTGIPDEDMADSMAQALEARLIQAGLRRYEVSAWARPGDECRHNLNYWEFGDYLGIGPGAHAKISLPDRILRETRPRQPRDWFAAVEAGQVVESQRVLDTAELPFEFMLNALRLTGGVPSALFSERTGLPFACLSSGIEQALARGLLDPDPARLRASPLGMRFLNDLVGIFLPD
jgi:putative oxygen-independent coproporphyrinogen III oxidase